MENDNENPLADAAKEMGAREIITEQAIIDAENEAEGTISESAKEQYEKARLASEVLGAGKIIFHNELPTIEFKYLVGHEFLVRQVMIIEDWDGSFGTSTFGLILIQLKNGMQCTTLGGGVAIIKQLRKMNHARKYPVKVKLSTRPGQQGGEYYVFE